MDTKIIPFAAEQTEEALRERLAQLRCQIAELDRKEPRNMESEAYEEWADAHEELEDLVDEILDQLDM